MSFLSDVLRQAGVARRAIRQAIDAEGGDRKIKTEEDEREVLRKYGPQPQAKRRLDFDEEPAEPVRPQAEQVPPKRKPQKKEEEDPEWNEKEAVSPKRKREREEDEEEDPEWNEEDEEGEEPLLPAAEAVPLELIKTLCLVHLTLPKPTTTATRVREKLQKLVEEHLLGELSQEADRIVSVSGRIRKFYPDMALISEDKLRQVGMLAQEFHRQEYGMPPTKVDKGDGFMVNGYTVETAPSTLDRAIVQIFGK